MHRKKAGVIAGHLGIVPKDSLGLVFQFSIYQIVTLFIMLISIGRKNENASQSFITVKQY